MLSKPLSLWPFVTAALENQHSGSHTSPGGGPEMLASELWLPLSLMIIALSFRWRLGTLILARP